jgi:hypothetical protein
LQVLAVVKGGSKIFSLVLFLAGAQAGISQNFTNLDFEDATIVRDTQVPIANAIYASDAIPGWTAYVNGTARAFISYGGQSSGEIELIGTNTITKPVQGDYSILLRGGVTGFPAGNITAAIGQTGLVPLSTESLTFWGEFRGKLSFGGQTLAYSVIGKTADYNIYGANISAYAGDNGQLLFSTVPNPNAPGELGGTIDNIQFSTVPVPVPEPGEMALMASGVLVFLGVRRNAPFVSVQKGLQE